MLKYFDRKNSMCPMLKHLNRKHFFCGIFKKNFYRKYSMCGMSKKNLIENIQCVECQNILIKKILSTKMF